MHMCVYIHIYIYIYIERERARDTYCVVWSNVYVRNGAQGKTKYTLRSLVLRDVVYLTCHI